MHAAFSGALDILIYLHKFSNNLNVDARTELGDTALILAACNDKTLICKYLVEEAKSDPFICGYLNQRASEWAWKSGSTETYEYLIAAENYINETMAAQISPLNLQSDLYEAISDHDSEQVRYLIKAQANINIKSIYGSTPLMYAAKCGDLSVVKALCDNGIEDEDLEDKNSRTAFTLAAKYGHTDILQYLFTYTNSKIDHKDKFGCTPLIWACYGRQFNTVKYLIESRASVTSTNVMGRDALMSAALSGDLKIVKYLVESCQTPIREHDKNGIHILNISRSDDVKLYLRTILSLDRKIPELNKNKEVPSSKGDAKTNLPSLESAELWNLSPSPIIPLNSSECLLSAAQKGDIKKMKTLCRKHRRDIDVCDIFGITPLLKAAQYGHVQIVRLLIEEVRADLSVRTKNNDTILMIASLAGRLDVVQYLDGVEKKSKIFSRALRKKSSSRGTKSRMVDRTNSHGDTALKLAASEAHYDVVSYLIHEMDANVHIKGYKGQTALDAAREAHRDCIKSIKWSQSIESNIHGKDRIQRNRLEDIIHLLKDYEKKTPNNAVSPSSKLLISCKKGDINATLVALRMGASPIERDHKMCTALILAVTSGHLECINALIENRTWACIKFINLSDSRGKTALMIAAKRGDLNIVSLLVRSKASVDLRDASHDTCLVIAAKSGHTKTVKYLVEEAKAYLYAEGENGYTALEWAKFYHHRETTEYLAIMMRGINRPPA
ncbi:hypothetical protein AAMO2058_000097800 [Amorphochlora amoebiformis]